MCTCGAGYNGSKKKALRPIVRRGAAAHRIQGGALRLDTCRPAGDASLQCRWPSVPAMIAVPDMRCPTCRSIAWARNGFVIAQNGDGLVDRRRVAPAERPQDGSPAAWSCARCGFAATVGTPLHRGLAELQVAHLE